MLRGSWFYAASLYAELSEMDRQSLKTWFNKNLAMTLINKQN